MPERPSSRDVISAVLDDASFVSWDDPVDLAEVPEDYRDELLRARSRSCSDEAILSGTGRLYDRQVVVVVGEFGFLGGSIGVAASNRLVRAVRRATAEGLPLLAAPASGGTRMQEGTRAFVEMIRISQAVVAHKAAGLPYLVYLRHPTTGGVFASWGSLGHITVAEPGALIGFLGPRVYQALYGEPFPAGVQLAENLVERGIVDAVVPLDSVADLTDRCLSIMLEPDFGEQLPEAASQQPEAKSSHDADAWQSVLRTRRPGRPGVRDLLRVTASDVIPLSGTGGGELDPNLLLVLTRIAGMACVLLGQDRRSQAVGMPLGPSALREARRGMRLAAELGLPLVSVIDTPGAALSREAEEGGLAAEIARCLADLSSLPVPTLAVLMGQGSGGAALALLPADRVVVAEHGWLSPLPPEGASAIVYADVDHAPELAAAQGIDSPSLHRAGIVDVVVPERPDAADEPVEFCRRLADVVGAELRALRHLDDADRMTRRWSRLP